MTKLLKKYINKIPTDLKHLIFSFISMEGEKYDKVYVKHSKAEYNYDNNRRKIYNYYDKEEKTKLEIMCLEALKKENEIKHEKKLKQLKDRLKRYENLCNKLKKPSAQLRTRMEEALKEKNAYLKLEKYLRKKYHKNHNNIHPHFYSFIYVSDSDTDSESDSESEN